MGITQWTMKVMTSDQPMVTKDGYPIDPLPLEPDFAKAHVMIMSGADRIDVHLSNQDMEVVAEIKHANIYIDGHPITAEEIAGIVAWRHL